MFEVIPPFSDSAADLNAAENEERFAAAISGVFAGGDALFHPIEENAV